MKSEVATDRTRKNILHQYRALGGAVGLPQLCAVN